MCWKGIVTGEILMSSECINSLNRKRPSISGTPGGNAARRPTWPIDRNSVKQQAPTTAD